MNELKKRLKKDLQEDKKAFYEYVSGAFHSSKVLWLTKDHVVEIYRYVKRFRYSHYYRLRYENGSKISLLAYLIAARRQNRLGNRLGIYISPKAEIGGGLLIYHHGSLIINGNVKIGSNCKFHGNNCIGNKGKEDVSSPVIGDYCDIGFGATIIGAVQIANHTSIGAGAVVTKDCLTENEVLIGVPANMKRSK